MVCSTNVCCSSVEMCNLGVFLTDDVAENASSFKEWLTDDNDLCTCSNATALEKDNGFILIKDLYSEEEVPTQLKLTYNQFLQILNDWEEKVQSFGYKKYDELMKRPTEVGISDNDDWIVMQSMREVDADTFIQIKNNFF